MSSTQHPLCCLLDLENFLIELALLRAKGLRHGVVQRLVIVVGQGSAEKGLRLRRRVIHLL